MIQLADIHSLTDFLRNHKEHVERLQREQRPEVLTVNGKAVIVVQDAVSYQRLLNQIERSAAMEGIQRGMADMEAGKGRQAAEFFREMKRKNGVTTARRGSKRRGM